MSGEFYFIVGVCLLIYYFYSLANSYLILFMASISDDSGFGGTFLVQSYI